MKIDTDIRAKEGQTVAEVATLWSDSILDVKQLGTGRGEQQQFTLGEAPECDCWLEPELISSSLGSSKIDIVTIASNGDVVAHLPAGAEVTLERPEVTIMGTDLLQEQGLAKPKGTGGADLLLEESWVIDIVIGEITFRIRRTSAGQLERGATPLDWSSIGWTGGSFLVHGLFLALVFAIPATPDSISFDNLDSDSRFTEYLVAPLEIAPPQPPDFINDSGNTTESTPERGSAHEGVGGQMGDRNAPHRDRHYAIRDRGLGEIRLAREQLREMAATGGILAAFTTNVPVSPFGSDVPNGVDAENALGHLIGATPGAAFGYGGLTLQGTGRGANGAPGTISIGLNLNTIGTVGSRNDHGRFRAGLDSNRSRRSTGPAVRHGTASVVGSLARNVIRRQIRLRRAEVAHCYQSELNGRPDLAGRVTIRFVIGLDGQVINSGVSSSSMESAQVGQCVAQVIRRITFPSPGNGVVIVNYPFTFVSQD